MKTPGVAGRGFCRASTTAVMSPPDSSAGASPYRLGDFSNTLLRSQGSGRIGSSTWTSIHQVIPKRRIIHRQAVVDLGESVECGQRGRHFGRKA